MIVGQRLKRWRIALDGQKGSYRMWEMNNQMSPLQPLLDLTLAVMRKLYFMRVLMTSNHTTGFRRGPDDIL